MVRSWSPDTRLNGRGFTDAQLLKGDRLSIGPIELEVVDASQAYPPATAAADTRDAETALAALRAQLDVERRQLAAEWVQLAAERAELRKTRPEIKPAQAPTQTEPELGADQTPTR